MKTFDKFILSLFMSLSSVFSLVPLKSSAREAALAPQEYDPNIARHFEAVWGYFEQAVEKNA